MDFLVDYSAKYYTLPSSTSRLPSALSARTWAPAPPFLFQGVEVPFFLKYRHPCQLFWLCRFLTKDACQRCDASNKRPVLKDRAPSTTRGLALIDRARGGIKKAHPPFLDDTITGTTLSPLIKAPPEKKHRPPSSSKKKCTLFLPELERFGLCDV